MATLPAPARCILLQLSLPLTQFWGDHNLGRSQLVKLAMRDSRLADAFTSSLYRAASSPLATPEKKNMATIPRSIEVDPTKLGPTQLDPSRSIEVDPRGLDRSGSAKGGEEPRKKSWAEHQKGLMSKLEGRAVELPSSSSDEEDEEERGRRHEAKKQRRRVDGGRVGPGEKTALLAAAPAPAQAPALAPPRKAKATMEGAVGASGTPLDAKPRKRSWAEHQAALTKKRGGKRL